MKLKLAVAALALLIATPTFAAEYYVIQSASNKKCSIASKKPTSDKMTLVGDGSAYKTKKEARTALKAADACKACPHLAAGGSPLHLALYARKDSQEAADAPYRKDEIERFETAYPLGTKERMALVA